MQVIEISKDKFLSYLLNPNPIFQGQFGKIVLDNNKLYKIYYRDFIKTYINKDECFLDDEVNSLLEIEKLTNFELRDPYKKLNELNRLARTKSASLITGVLSYNGLLVGIQMNYLKNYTTLKEISTRVEDSKLVIYLNKAYEIVYDLLKENIVPTDVKEDNILVN